MLSSTAQKNLSEWQSKKLDASTRDELKRLLKMGDAAVEDAFGSSLSFGTAGLRGLMGVGTNRLNRYTIAATTEGLARYLKKLHGANPMPIRVLVGYDSRHNSALFAQITARVFAANGFEVGLFAQMRPISWVSFGVRHFHCAAGVMITASHNPGIYNGYKVFGPDGGQILSPVDAEILAQIQSVTDITTISLSSPDSSKIINIQGELDDEYVAALQPLQNFPYVNKEAGTSLYVVYSSLHGTGITVIDRVLASWGFCRLSYVASQVIPDGDFPTAPSPNPEIPQAMQLGMEQLEYEEGDILLVNDPDADRIGIACLHEGKAHAFSGNQMISICLHYLGTVKREIKKLPKHSASITTIVTSSLFQKISESLGIDCVEVLTGFKYIGHQITAWEKSHAHSYLFGGEESYGALYGTHVRDKDGIVMAALLCEIALYLKQRGLTFLDYWNVIQKEYGVYTNLSDNVLFSESESGHQAMDQAMRRLRRQPPSQIGAFAVKAFRDYEIEREEDPEAIVDALPLPKANVLQFSLENGDRVMVRPSGTEPKVKIYVETSNPVGKEDLEELQKQTTQRAKELMALMKKLILG